MYSVLGLIFTKFACGINLILVKVYSVWALNINPYNMLPFQYCHMYIYWYNAHWCLLKTVIGLTKIWLPLQRLAFHSCKFLWFYMCLHYNQITEPLKWRMFELSTSIITLTSGDIVCVPTFHCFHYTSVIDLELPPDAPPPPPPPPPHSQHPRDFNSIVYWKAIKITLVWNLLARFSPVTDRHIH